MSLIPRPTVRAALLARTLLLAGLVLSAALPPPALADDSLDAVVLKKVKAATVHLRVKLTDGRVVQGSGFFTDEPGLIVTNAHVLNMLDAESRKPLQIDVTMTDNDKSRTLRGKVVGVDRGTDLGLIRVEDKELPEPIALGKAESLKETDTVFVFGFPFGTDLGKEITVSKSSVSKIIKSSNGTVMRLQLDGGLNPGNSGGPVVDAKGNVVGVAVSAIKGAQIGFAIASHGVETFFNGRIIASNFDVPVKGAEGDELKLPVTFELVDPLGRLKMVEAEVWVGNSGNSRPPSAKQPVPMAGDSPVKKFDMKYDKKAVVSFDVPIPPLTDPDKQVWWVRPVITNGKNEIVWVTAIAKKPQPPMERKPIALKYKPPINDKQTADLVSLGGFKIRPDDGADISLDMNLKAAITEQFADAEAKVFPMRLVYNRFTLGVLLDGKPMKDNKDIQSILGDIRFLAANVDMDKDGGVSTAKADLTKVPRSTRSALSDISDQVLEAFELLSIPLPDRKLEPGETWKAHRDFQIGPGVIAVEAQGDLIYTYRGIQNRSGTDVMLIRIEGQIKGRRGDGTNLGGKLSGSAVINPDTGVVIHADAKVTADVDFVMGRKPAKAMGTLSVSLDRPAKQPEKK